MAHPDETSDAEKTFGAAVRDRREALRLTQEQVRRRLLEAYRIDLSKTAMIRLEQGKRPIRFTEVSALARLLNIDLAPWSNTRPAVPEPSGLDKQALGQYAQMEKMVAEARAVRDAIRADLAAATDNLIDADHRRADLRRRVENLHQSANAAEQRLALAEKELAEMREWVHNRG